MHEQELISEALETLESLEVCPSCGAEGVVVAPALPVSVGHWVIAAA